MIEGYCDEKFSSARDLFEKNLKSGFERGAAITVEIEGEKALTRTNIKRMAPKPQLITSKKERLIPSTTRFLLTGASPFAVE